MSKKKDSKKKKQEDEDDSTSQIMKFYRRKLEALNVPICKNFREKVEQALDNQEHLKAVINFYKFYYYPYIIIVSYIINFSFTTLKFWDHREFVQLWRVYAKSS